MYKVIVQSSMLRHQKKLRKEEEIEERCIKINTSTTDLGFIARYNAQICNK